MSEKNSSLKKYRFTKLQVFLIIACIYIELCFHLLIFGTARGLGYAALCGGLCGSVLALISMLLPEKAGRICSWLLLFAAGFFACVQMIYYAVFGTLMQLSLVRMGGDVFGTFGTLILSTVLKNWYKILLLMLPSVLMPVLRKRFEREKPDRACKITASAVLCAFLAFVLVFGLIPPAGAIAPLGIYKNAAVSTELSYQRLGFAGGIARDLLYGVFSEKNTSFSADIEGVGSQSEYDKEKYNVQDIDFAALAASTDDASIKALDEYFASVAPTEKNEYTGMLSGYNLITICAESFSPYLISEELTPTLYKLSHNGIIFENYYGTYQSLTSNGEYTMNIGLYPNMHNSSAATSFEDSIGKYLPYCLGNALQGKGYSCYAYHNNVGEFYSRNLSHPNMGYDFKAAGSGLDIHLSNPASDLELFQQSVPDFQNSAGPFHAYYMSWSGHNPYNWTNVMSEKNRDTVSSLNYSDSVRAYIACNLELEYGLSYLMDELERTGLADRTVIVLTNDHYPYGLTKGEYDELAGFEIEGTFEKYRNSFICYVPGLEENITVSEYCSTADILPTLLNLFGAEFDSRLLAGRDVLSDGLHVAVLANQSFITDEFRFDASQGIAADNVRKDARGYTEADYQRYIANMFAVSSTMMDCNYYGHVFSVDNSGDGSLLVNYKDIGNVFHKSAVQYVVKNGLMTAESDELFGGENTACVGELLQVLRRIADLPDAEGTELMSWAVENGIFTAADELDLQEPLTHVSCAVIMARFAEYMGVEVRTEGNAAEYSELGSEAARACLWATETTVMNKTMEFIMENREITLNRFQLAAYVSYLCTRALGI